MFEVGQRVVFKTKSINSEAGTKGTIVDIDEEDEELPYLVDYKNKYGYGSREWCGEKEVEEDS